MIEACYWNGNTCTRIYIQENQKQIHIHVCFNYAKYIRNAISDLMNNWSVIFLIGAHSRTSYSEYNYALLSTTLKPEVIKFWGTLSAEHASEIGSKMISSVSVVRLAQ